MTSSGGYARWTKRAGRPSTRRSVGACLRRSETASSSCELLNGRLLSVRPKMGDLIDVMVYDSEIICDRPKNKLTKLAGASRDQRRASMRTPERAARDLARERRMYTTSRARSLVRVILNASVQNARQRVVGGFECFFLRREVVRWTNAVLPRGHRSVQRVIWLVQSGYTWYEPDDSNLCTLRYSC